MKTKAQLHFNKILKELDLTKLTRKVWEFQFINKRALTEMWKAFTGSYGGIKVVIDNDTPTPSTSEIVFVFHGKEQLGAWFDGRYFDVEGVNGLIKFINFPPSKK